MVVIHLAKLTLLEKSCDYFKDVEIPRKVHEEIMKGKRYPETRIIEMLIGNKKIKVKEVQNKAWIKKAEAFSLQRGEAEAVALYWQEKANYLATDDDNVRKKSLLLNLVVIGTPAIITKLYKEHKINKEKFQESMRELKKIGWFSNAIIDKMMMEV